MLPHNKLSQSDDQVYCCAIYANFPISGETHFEDTNSFFDSRSKSHLKNSDLQNLRPHLFHLKAHNENEISEESSFEEINLCVTLELGHASPYNLVNWKTKHMVLHANANNSILLA